MADDREHLWLGCTTRYFLKDSVGFTRKILNRLRLDCRILDLKEDICCGSVLFNIGRRRDALENMKKVNKIMKSSKGKGIITICPGCAKTFKEHYGMENVKHIVEVMSENTEKLRLRNNRKIIVTYHDPCHLGRGLEIFEQPRKVINAVPEVIFKEMRMNREKAFCCGSGGGLRANNKELADFASWNRLNEAKATGAEYLITACPFCERSFKEVKGPCGKGLKVVNIVDFVCGHL